jgi:hypothetical protein
MRYSPDRAGKNSDLAATLKVCPVCLGDLVLCSDPGGTYYACNQCHVRANGRSHSGRIANLPLVPALDALATPRVESGSIGKTLMI